MTLTVYGSSECAQCKAFLSMARARGLDPRYFLIDQDEGARAAYEAIEKPGRQLPLAVLTQHSGTAVAAGLQAAIYLLKNTKE